MSNDDTPKTSYDHSEPVTAEDWREYLVLIVIFIILLAIGATGQAFGAI